MSDGSQPASKPQKLHPRRDVAGGVLIAIALISLLFAPLWIINLLQVGLAAWLVLWSVRADASRFVDERGMPRLWLFGLGAAGIVANLTILRFLERTGVGRATLALSLAFLITALVVAAVKAARRFPDRFPGDIGR